MDAFEEVDSAPTARDEKRCRQIGEEIDRLFARNPRILERFLKMRDRYVDMCIAHGRLREEHGQLELRRAREVVLQGTLNEATLNGRDFAVTPVHVSGWFPTSQRPSFQSGMGGAMLCNGALHSRVQDQADLELPAPKKVASKARKQKQQMVGHASSKHAAVLRAVRQVLDDPNRSDSGTRPRTLKNAFWGTVLVWCEVPPLPDHPADTEGIRSLRKEDRLAVAYAKLLALRDEACRIPVDVKTNPGWRSHPEEFRREFSYLVLRPAGQSTKGPYWRLFAKEAEELLRLVQQDLRTLRLVRRSQSGHPPAAAAGLKAVLLQQITEEPATGKEIARRARRTYDSRCRASLRALVDSKLCQHLSGVGGGYFRPAMSPKKT